MRIEFRNSTMWLEGPTPRVGDVIDHGGQEFVVTKVYWEIHDYEEPATLNPVVVLEIFSASSEENRLGGSGTGV